MKRNSLYLSLAVLIVGQSFAAPVKPAATSKAHAGLHNQFVPGRYIVELSGEPVISAVAKSPGVQLKKLANHEALVTQHRARVAQEQSRMRPALSAKGATVHHSVDLVMNALMVKYAGNRADLEALPGVKHVYPVRMTYANLDHAVVVHHVTDVWNQIGGSANSGAGIKIGMLDTGIEWDHPAFKDTGFQAPPGYPKADNSVDLGLTNNKIIVARSYAKMIDPADQDPTIQDHVGHGTATAMVAAGVTNTGPLGAITGVVSGAYLGVYRIFDTLDSYSTEDVEVAAINDAVADGMDVLNMSVGSSYATRFDQDPVVIAVENAYKAGVLFVSSAGNDGPAYTTIASPATAPHAIAVGASTSDRAFGPGVFAPYLGTLQTFNPGDVIGPNTPITAPLIDASTLNNTYGCSSFDSSVSGKIVLIARGPSGGGACSFATKLSNAQAAGAVAGLISDYQANSDAGTLVVMTEGSATLPAQSIGFYDAQALSQQVAQAPLSLTIGFTEGAPFAVTPNYLVSFSSTGPNVDLSIKPDVSAIGENVYMATQYLDSYGQMYDSTGYTIASGTSFSSPFTAGVAAMIKAARPGLTIDQYRSLIINTANSALAPNANDLGPQKAGSGILNALSAFRAPMTASPTSLGLGTSSDTVQLSTTVTLTNIGAADDTFSMSTAAIDGGLQPIVPNSAIAIPAGQSQGVPLQFTGSGLPPGAHQGFIVATSAATGAQIRIPYWLDVPSTDPRNILVMYADPNYEIRNTTVLDVFEFRLTDSAGAPMTNVKPQVTAITGGGSVVSVNSADDPNAQVNVGGGYITQDVPGLWTVDVKLGSASGDNLFRVTAGPLTLDFIVTGCRSISFAGSCNP